MGRKVPEIAKQYLEDLQRRQAESGRYPDRYFGKKPVDRDELRRVVDSTVPKDHPEREREIERRHAKELEDYDKAAANLPTTLQNPFSYGLVKDLFEQVRNVAGRMGMGGLS